MALGKRRKECEDLVDEVDKERIAYIKHYFNAEWPKRSLYHLMINTGVGDQNVLEAILNGMERLAVRPAKAPCRSDSPAHFLNEVGQPAISPISVCQRRAHHPRESELSFFLSEHAA